MKTVQIQINDNNVYDLLKNLEELNLIILDNDSSPKQKFSKKYSGKQPEGIVEEHQKYVSENPGGKEQSKYLIATNAVIDYLGKKFPSSGMEYMYSRKTFLN